MPLQLSLECRDLLDRIFIVDDARRITIDQIRSEFTLRWIPLCWLVSGFQWVEISLSMRVTLSLSGCGPHPKTSIGRWSTCLAVTKHFLRLCRAHTWYKNILPPPFRNAEAQIAKEQAVLDAREQHGRFSSVRSSPCACQTYVQLPSVTFITWSVVPANCMRLTARSVS